MASRKGFEVKLIEFKFNHDVLNAEIVEIQEKFLSKAISTFRTKARNYAKIEFEFIGEGGIPMEDAIKMFEEWTEVIEIHYTVNLHQMVILLRI